MKKVLIITYYWPPAGGVSVLRSLKIAKYLNRLEWEPIIYTAKDAQYPYYDESNTKDIPQGITIIRRPIFEPFNIFKKITGRGKDDTLNNILHVRDKKFGILDKLGIWIRGNFFIPDARSFWIKPSTRFLIKYLKKNPVDAIFTDGPPHTNTVIALNIKKVLNIPWLADFQDPWTQVDYYKLFKISNWAHKKHVKLEQEVFKYADKITTVSKSWKSDLEKIGARDVGVIYWGFDEEDFRDLTYDRDPFFSISHVGLLGLDRKPDMLFKGLEELKQEIPGFGQNLRLKFAGQLDYSVIESIENSGLKENMNLLGIITRAKSLETIFSSYLLLLPLNKSENAEGRVPGKFFEYLKSSRPILYLGPEKSDVIDIINKTRRGEGFDYDDKAGIKSYIRQLYSEYLNQGIVNCDLPIDEYSIGNQTQKISKYLTRIIESE